MIFTFSGVAEAIWRRSSGTMASGYRSTQSAATAGKFIWPSAKEGVISISAGQMAYMLEGIRLADSATDMEAEERRLRGEERRAERCEFRRIPARHSDLGHRRIFRNPTLSGVEEFGAGIL